MEIIVIGMHRSGTSLVSGVLNKMGVYFGEPSMLMKDESNAKGYFERIQVRDVHDFILRFNGFSWLKISGYHATCLGGDSQKIFDNGMGAVFDEFRGKDIWGVKDPRICLTFPLWKKHLENPVCIFAFRNPIHVALSLNKRDGLHPDFGLALWEKYNISGLNNISGFPVIFIDFDLMVKEPYTTIEKLHSSLKRYGATGIQMLNDESINALVDPGLVHHGERSPVFGVVMSASQSRLYGELRNGEAMKACNQLPVPDTLSGVLKDNEDIVVHGTREEVVNNKLLGMIDGDRQVVLNIGDVSSKLTELLKDRLPGSKIINAGFTADINKESPGTGAFLLGKKRELYEYVAAIVRENIPDLVIFNKSIFKFESVAAILSVIKNSLAGNSQVLVLDKNPKNIISVNKLIKHDIWQGSAGSGFDYHDNCVLTMHELSVACSVCGYRVLSSDFNVDSRLLGLYRQGMEQKNTPDLNLDKIILKQVTKPELKELCSNYMYLSLKIA